jgi:transcriptional regulator with XRE-family HTH domain/tetratricopeptide (TPR) repeat protein
MKGTDPRLPPDFWSRPDIALALASCDVPALLSAIRAAHGWTQGELAAVLGYSQTWASRVLRGEQALTIDQVRDAGARLGVPLHLLRFGERGGKEDPTKRRDFGMAVALAGLAALPAPRRAGLDETTAPTLTAITGAYRRLEPATPAHELTGAAEAHVNVGSAALARDRRSRFAPDVAAAVSEAAGFAAWLRMDMNDAGSARAYYRAAIDQARHAAHPLLAAYMLGSLASFEIEAGDPDTALDLTALATRHLSERGQPTARAWLNAVRAVGHAARGDAARGDADAADRALAAAEDLTSQAGGHAPPPWPWVFPFDAAKLAGYAALVAVRLQRPGQAAAAFAHSVTIVTPAPKQATVLMLELAELRRQQGDLDEAVTLASQALATGRAHASERVIAKARRFRRACPAQPTPALRAFDQRLRETMPA